MRVATTNVQLFNLLQIQGRSIEDLALVGRTYELSRTRSAGWYQADGTPFVTHGVGVASVMAELGHPAAFVAAGLVHNIYDNGDFGDGRQHAVTPRRRRIVRAAVGPEVEELVVRFRDYRVTECPIDRFEAIEAGLDRLDETERRLIVLDLADLLQKYSDDGIAYFGDGEWITGAVAARGERLLELARRVGEPELARALEQELERAATTPIAPDVLRPVGQQYLELTVPPSCRRRILPVARRRARRAVSVLRRSAPRWGR